jgi:hypothetical protein
MTDEWREKEAQTGPDESYALARRLLYAPYFGFVVGRGDLSPAELASLRDDFAETLTTEGVAVTDTDATSWDIGRSAAAYEVFLYVSGGIASVAVAIKQADDAVAVLRKWWRALSRARRKLGGGQLTVESLKLACLVDIAERQQGHASPELDRIVAAAGAAQYGDGTWHLADPVYVAIPDRLADSTYLYVISLDGTILHRSVLPYFAGSDLEKFRLSIVSSAGAAREPESPTEPDCEPGVHGGQA